MEKPIVSRRSSCVARRRSGPIVRPAIGGTRVELAQKEYELLLRLASDPERVFTKEELLRDVWGFRTRSRTRTLDAHASRLRRKLRAADPVAPLVENEWGVGYRLLGPLPG